MVLSVDLGCLAGEREQGHEIGISPRNRELSHVWSSYEMSRQPLRVIFIISKRKTEKGDRTASTGEG